MNIIIITGASSGLGQEFAFQIDTAFSNIDEIWLIARREDRLKEIAKVMEHKTRILTMDVTDEYAMDDFEKLLEATDVKVRMLINCAGYGLMGSFDEMVLEDQLGMLTTNCEALTRITYLCLPYMHKNSRIIQLASSAAFLPQPGFAVYAASKAYVLSFSRALNEELRSKNIFVTAVCPGPVDTGFFEIAEQYGETLQLKKLVMATSEKVVEKALKDSYLRKATSIYSFPIKALKIASKMFSHDVILSFTRYLK